MLTAPNVVAAQFGDLESFSSDVGDESRLSIVKHRSLSPVPPRVEVSMRLDNSPEAPTRGGVYFSDLESFGMDGIDGTVPAVPFGALDLFNIHGPDGPPKSNAIEVDVAAGDSQVAPLPEVPFARLEPLDLGDVSPVPPRRPTDPAFKMNNPAAAGGVLLNRLSEDTAHPQVPFAALAPLEIHNGSPIPAQEPSDPGPGMSGPAAAVAPSTPFKTLILLEQTLEELLEFHKPGEKLPIIC